MQVVAGNKISTQSPSNHSYLVDFFVFVLLEEFAFYTQQSSHVLPQYYILHRREFYKGNYNYMYNLYFLTEAPLITQDADIHNTPCSILLHDTVAADIYQTFITLQLLTALLQCKYYQTVFLSNHKNVYQETVLTYFFVYFFIIFHFSEIHIIYQQSFAH